MPQPEGNVINTAQEALEYMLESWDVPHDLRAGVEREINRALHHAVGDRHPIDLQKLRDEMRRLNDAALGQRLREFILEAEHGEFDGWDLDEERKSIERLFDDMALWLENYDVA